MKDWQPTQRLGVTPVGVGCFLFVGIGRPSRLEPDAWKQARSVRQWGDGETRRSKGRKVRPVPTITAQSLPRVNIEYGGSMTQDNRDTLELSTFIRETLLQIVRGVEQARDSIKEIETNAEICPTGLHFKKGKSPAPFKPGRGFVQEVEFDVAITVSKGQSSDGTGEVGLNLGVPALQWLAGAKVEGNLAFERQQERSMVNRVTFRVPVLLPSEVYPWNEEEQGQESQ